MRRRKLRIRNIFIIPAVCILLIGTVFVRYVNTDVYAPEAQALAACQSTDTVTVKEEDGALFFIPEEYTEGMIFYPGAKVEYESYAPLMMRYAEEGILCVLVQMPFNMAVLGMNKADDYLSSYPVREWYIAGHSLGAAMAAQYAYSHASQLEGVILLAGYSTKDLHDTGLQVLSVYGSEDQVLNSEKYETYRVNLPEDAEEEVIIGGNHSQFGSYGFQKGDNEASISSDLQKDTTVQYTLMWMAS